MGEPGTLTFCARTHRDLEFVLSDHLTEALPSVRALSPSLPPFFQKVLSVCVREPLPPSLSPSLPPSLPPSVLARIAT